MATAEEGGAATTTTTAATSYGGEGAAGGKFRKKPFRKTTTPYDRPAIALLGNGSSSSSWLSKLVVDPASKLISYGARRFFDSVFRKRRLPPPPPQTSESNHVLRDGRPEAVLSEPARGECSKPLSSCRNGISDLEQLLEQKTFTRSEIDHLTKLLHSRAGEESLRDDGKRNGVTVSDFGGHQRIESYPMEVNRYEQDRSHGVDSKVLGDSIASPSEHAKAYMGSRPSKLSPSVLGNHSQVTSEDTKLLSNTRVAPKPVSMSLTKKSTVSSGSPGNGYMINTRSIGRSAIYNMARTPYPKRTGINLNGYAGLPVPSTSLTLLESCENSEPKSMTLKRRSFVLDDEVGSVGPIRRIRQKSNLIAPGVHHTERDGSKSDAVLVSSKQKFPLNGDAKHFQRTVKENTDVSIPSTSYAIVPLKSHGVKVAVRRFGNLEKRPLKGKSSESNMVAVRQKSTFQSTPSMLRGQALRSKEDATFSELLLNVQDDHNFESNAGFMDADDSTPQDQGKIEENSPIETSSPSHTYYPVNNSESAVSFEADLVRGRTADDVENGFSEPQNKAAFRMSALEDYVDLDDDLPCNELVSHPSSDWKGPMEAHLTHSKLLPLDEHNFSETTTQPELKSCSDPISSKKNQASSAVADAASLGEQCNGIITPASEEVTAAARPSIPASSVAAFDQPKEITNPQTLFSFSSKDAYKFPSSTPESSRRTPESSCSMLDVFAPTSSPATVSETEKGGNLKPLAAEDTIGKPDTVTSAASSGLLVSNAPAGSLTATYNNNTHQIFTAPVIFTPSVSVSDFISPGTGSVSSATSSGIVFGASERPKVSGEPPFKFGASPDPSTKVSAASTTIIPAGDLTNKAVNDPSSGSSGSSPTNFVAFGTSSSGNMTSGLCSSTSNPSANNSQGSLFGNASKSTVPAVGNVSEGPSTQSNSFAPPPSSNMNSNTSFVSSLFSAQVSSPIMPFGFNSSASSSDTGVVASSSGSASSLFGMNPTAVSDGSAGGSSSLTTSSMLNFGLSSSASSINAVESTGCATAPVLNSSGSASVITSAFGSSPSPAHAIGSTGGAAAPVFGFGAVGSTGGATALVFGFGASSSCSASVITSSFSSSSSTTSAVGSTSGAAPSVFSFGLSNPTSTSASNAASSFSNGAFSFGGSFSASSSAINSVNSNNAPSNPFGSSLQAPPTSSIFGSSPSTGFAFGASTTSSAPINAAPVVFNSSTAPSSSSPFLFSSAPASVFSSPAPSLSQPVFGNATHGFAASSPGNNFQMNGEDSMAEDPVQSTAPSVPVFGQANVSPSPPGFMFGSTTVPSQANPFQFGGQQNRSVPQNQSVFQASSSLEFNAGGSFSLGSGGGDKSGRKYVKVNRNKNRKK